MRGMRVKGPGGARRRLPGTAVWVLGVAVAAALAACVQSPAPPSPGTSAAPPGGLTRTHEGGAVTVSLTYLNPGAEGARFEVAMETHSVELGGYDLETLATLADGAGKRQSPARWEPRGSGHHVFGTLTFPERATPPVTVTLRDLAGVPERTFRWEGVL